MTGIIVKQYEHFNRAFPEWDCSKGKYVRSKAHYEELMQKYGYQPYDGSGSPEHKPYQPTEEIKRDLYKIRELYNRDGSLDPINVRGIKEIMEKHGISFNPKFLPEEN